MRGPATPIDTHRWPFTAARRKHARTIGLDGRGRGLPVGARRRPAFAQFYEQHNMVSDGSVPADHVDPCSSTPGARRRARRRPGGSPTTAPDTRRSTTAPRRRRAAHRRGAGRPDRRRVQRQPGGVPGERGLRAVHLRDRRRHDPRLERRHEPRPSSCPSAGAIYKGLAIDPTLRIRASTPPTSTAARVDVFDGSFGPVGGGVLRPDPAARLRAVRDRADRRRSS